MAVIGEFTKSGEIYAGAVHTLNLDVKATLKPTGRTEGKGPDFRIFSGQAEIGAAWAKTSGEGRDYLSLKFDDPSFDKPFYASLVENDDGFVLIWSRPERPN